MKRFIALLLSLTLLFSASACAGTAPETKRTTAIVPRFASVEEGQALMRGRTLYHEQINEMNLAFLLQKKGGTLEEYIDFSAEQVIPFTEEEELRIRGALLWLQEQLEKYGLALPDPEPITFVKTTGDDMPGAFGYTSGGTVFLETEAFGPDIYDELFLYILIHELFHCLSRLFPDFRAAMYSLIHFRVLEEEISLPEEIRERMVANPDVERHDSIAVFTVGGEKKECCLLLLTDSVFEKPGDTFFDQSYTAVMPLDGTGVFRSDDVPDFLDVVGKDVFDNKDPEEIMAESFALAILNQDFDFEGFENPEILRGVVDLLKADH